MSIQAAQLLKNVFGEKSYKKLNGVFGGLSEENTAEQSAGEKDGFSIEAEWMEFLDPTAGLEEEEKQAYESRIMQKLRSGKKLTPEEMNYLRAKNPQLYAQAARVQAMRENLKNQLENCKSKEEAEKVYGNSVSMINKDDPMREAIVAAYDDVMKEFKKTDKYQALPQKEEDAEEQDGCAGKGRQKEWQLQEIKDED